MKTLSCLTLTTFTLSVALTLAQEPPATPASPRLAPGTPGTPPPVETSPAGPTSTVTTNTTPPAKTATRSTRKPNPVASAPEKLGPPVTVGPAAAKQNNINVRTKASLKSEVVTRLTRGDKLEVLEIIEQKPKPDEPDKWARIALPPNAAVWVSALFVDPTNKTAKSRLNVRSGPSENHSVLGRLDRGAAVKEIERKEDWIRIEPPQGIYGFVAAHLLTPAVAPPVEVVKTEVPKTDVPRTEVAPPVEIAKAEPPQAKPGDATATPTPPLTEVAATPATPSDAHPAGAPPSEDEIKRVVSREGIVKRSVSIQAPTWFVLESPSTGKAINYLFTPSAGIVLRDYFGQRVIVTGEEGLDERWPNTPVINVESIEIVP